MASDLHTTIASINPEFAAALRDAGVNEEFARDRDKGSALHTVFVPAPAVYNAALLEHEDPAERRRLLRYYAVAGRMTGSELTNLESIPTLTGQSLDIKVDDDRTFFAVNQARVTRPNVVASNGVVHVVDTMLVPPDHPAAGTLRNESPTLYIRLDPTIATACGMPQPRAFFEFDSAELRRSASDSLEALAPCLTTGALAGHRLIVEGYTDPRGDASYNKELARSRALAVTRALAQEGVPEELLLVRSHGEEFAHDENPDFWDLDRRVDIRIASGAK